MTLPQCSRRFMTRKTTQLSLLMIFIAVLFIQTAVSSGRIYAIAQQNSSIVNTNSTNPLLLNEENILNRIFKQTEESVVTVIRTLPSSTTVTTPETQNTTVLESGFLYDNQGHIITTSHSVGDTKIVNVLFENGNRRTAKVIGSDPLSDIAVLKIIENISRSAQPKTSLLPTPLTIGNSSNASIGQPVFAIGNPYGLEGTMTTGIVSQTGRLVPLTTSVEKFLGLHFPWVAYSIADVIQTDAPINQGNSGGPLLNLQGQVIGMNTATISHSNGIGFAISSNALSRIVPILVAKGNYTHPYLGLALETSPSAVAEDYESVPANLKGVFVNVIEKGGPADKAGIKGSNLDQYYKRHSGDMIVAVDGHNVTKAEDLMSYIEGHKTPGDSVNLTVYRDGKMLNLTANLKPWPSLATYTRQATSSSNPE
jgi:S1-C subfamily serine protease